MYIMEILMIQMNVLILSYLFYRMIYWLIYDGITLDSHKIWGGLLFFITIFIIFWQARKMRLIYIYQYSWSWKYFQGICFLTLILIILTSIFFFGEQRQAKEKMGEDSVQMAVDSIAQGLCIYQENGMPILVNQKMNEWVYLYLSKTIIDGNIIWSELKDLAENASIFLEKEKHLSSILTEQQENEIYLPTIEDSIIRFIRNKIIEDGVIYWEIEATDVSEIIDIAIQLYDKNLHLSAQYEKIKEQARRKKELQKSEEILEEKVYLHRKLGECIITTQNMMYTQRDMGVDTLEKLWLGIVDGLQKEHIGEKEMNYEEELEELKEVAHMIGCEIIFIDGERKTLRGEKDIQKQENVRNLKNKNILETKNSLKERNQAERKKEWKYKKLDLEEDEQELYIALIREALGNAVRHGKATELYVQTISKETLVYIKITDNGYFEGEEIKEGGGITNLRRMFENEGVELRSSVGDEGVQIEGWFKKKERNNL